MLIYLSIYPPFLLRSFNVSVSQGMYTFHSHLTPNLSFPWAWMVFLNSWSVSVVSYYVSASGDSMNGELNLWRMSIHSLSVNELLEYRR